MLSVHGLIVIRPFRTVFWPSLVSWPEILMNQNLKGSVIQKTTSISCHLECFDFRFSLFELQCGSLQGHFDPSSSKPFLFNHNFQFLTHFQRFSFKKMVQLLISNQRKMIFKSNNSDSGFKIIKRDRIINFITIRNQLMQKYDFDALCTHTV